MLSFLRLFNQYVIRDMMRNRLRAVLTTSGIALGIAVVVAVQLANARAIGAFNDSLRALAGQADLQISANGLPLTEKLITDLAWVWEYGAMSPLVQGRGVLG